MYDDPKYADHKMDKAPDIVGAGISPENWHVRPNESEKGSIWRESIYRVGNDLDVCHVL